VRARRAMGPAFVGNLNMEGILLEPVTASAPTTETAVCWIVVTNDSRFTYTTNAGSGTVTGFRIVPGTGALHILDPDGVTADLGPGANPIDEALSSDSRFLYVLSPMTAEIAAFEVHNNGSLEPMPSTFGLPATAGGLAAR
jgi:6-phosphogluconolactonase